MCAVCKLFIKKDRRDYPAAQYLISKYYTYGSGSSTTSPIASVAFARTFPW